MASYRLAHWTAFSLVVAAGALSAGPACAESPTPAQALTLTPIQQLVEYATPTKEEAAQCTIRPEKEGGVTSWVVRNKHGETLRRFADTNSDNIVDLWCYYLGGFEVYRDIDSNFNGKADQYRWFHTAGTRWGLDRNEDGHIDSWKVISPHEVAEQVVFALKTRDPARFDLVLLKSDELAALGLGKAWGDQIGDMVKAAPSGFAKLMVEQKLVAPNSRCIDFGSGRPASVPANTAGSTKDVVICDNSVALVQTGDKHDQVFLGTLVAVGDTWKLIGAPTLDANKQPQDGGLLAGVTPQTPGDAGGNAPSDEMQKLLTELEKLDKQSETLPADQVATNVEQRAELFRKIAAAAPDAERDQWYSQLADLLSTAIQTGNYPDGVARLDQLEKDVASSGNQDLAAHVEFQRAWAQYILSQRDPKANPGQVQDKWLADLQAFVDKYPKSPDSAEALLQLGMLLEFVGKSEDANKWYQQLVSSFPNSAQKAKAAGALQRLGSVGKPMMLRGKELSGADLNISSYRGKVVLVHYWATWCPLADMVLLRDLHAKKGGKDFDVIGVCLDANPAVAKQFLAQNKFPWKQIHESGGLDGRLANEMGVMTPPLMVLVDQKGNVVNQNVHVAELETQLARLLTPAPAGGAANASRDGTTPR
jgi:tetratricopeptide (TPR) repeat protein